MIGTNAFQVRRTPIAVGLLDDDDGAARSRRRPIITPEDAEVVRRALPDAEAVALQSGWPTPVSDVVYRNQHRRRRADLRRHPALPDRAGLPLRRRRAADRPRRRERRPGGGAGLRRGRQAVRRSRARPIGQKVRVGGREFDGQGRDRQEGQGAGPVVRRLRAAAAHAPSSRSTAGGRPRWSRSRCATPSEVDGGDGRGPRRRCGSPTGSGPARPNDFTVDKADALVAFWKSLTRVLFTVIPAVVCIGIVVGGIVIMNIMLMIGERAHPRDRHPQVARRHAAATSGASSWSRRSCCRCSAGCWASAAGWRWPLLVSALHAAAGAGHPLVGGVALGARRRHRHPLRGVPGRPRRAARPDHRARGPE